MNWSTALAACCTSHRKARASRSIHKLPGPVDGSADERIPDCRSFDQIDRAAEKVLQRVCQSKELVHRIESAFSLEFDKEIHVALNGIKIRAAGGGAEHVQPPHVVALAQRLQGVAPSGYLSVHGGLRL